jgi:hypothetical protein
MISEETRNKWKSKLKVILNHQNKLNNWELGFIDSIDMILNKDDDISLKQSSILTRVYEKVSE